MGIFATDENSTPLTLEEKEGLKQSWITLRSELNELETQNILNAQVWLSKKPNRNILSDEFLKKLHKKMFDEVWKWAGAFRASEKNIGVTPFQIIMKSNALWDDVNFWIKNKTFSNKEIAVRLHHRLVSIHPFPNGNGRVSRLMADLLMKQFNEEPLNWGDSSLIDSSSLRAEYIKALQLADKGSYEALLNFVSTEIKL